MSKSPIRRKDIKVLRTLRYVLRTTQGACKWQKFRWASILKIERFGDY